MLRSAASSSRMAINSPCASALRSTSALSARGLASSASRFQASEVKPPPKMIKLTVDGKEVEVEQGYVYVKHGIHLAYIVIPVRH